MGIEDRVMGSAKAKYIGDEPGSFFRMIQLVTNQRKNLARNAREMGTSRNVYTPCLHLVASYFECKKRLRPWAKLDFLNPDHCLTSQKTLPDLKNQPQAFCHKRPSVFSVSC
jgi:hypothetical protein